MIIYKKLLQALRGIHKDPMPTGCHQDMFSTRPSPVEEDLEFDVPALTLFTRFNTEGGGLSEVPLTEDLSGSLALGYDGDIKYSFKYKF